MKIFQIEAGICHWDASNVLQSLDDAKVRFPPSLLFVEAPDYVFEGWGYLDGEFIKPAAPEGWVYDESNGTFYPEPTTKEQREKAYNTEHIIEWNGELLTVTEAATQWLYYAAEGSDKANEIQALIAAAKSKTRVKYPDQEG